MTASADTSLFKPELVFFDFEATTRDEFFSELGRRLDAQGYLKETWYEAVTARERAYPTGLQTPTLAIAIPHTDPQYLKRPYIAVVKPRRPIEFEAMAGIGDPVEASLIINLGVLRDGGQVEVLQTLMNVFMDDAAAAKIMAQTTPEGMVSAITEHFA